MIAPFDSGRKPINEYTPRELLMGAQAQARHAADELRYLARDASADLPPVYVAIDVGDGGSVLVSYTDATKEYGYWFARAQLVDDGDPANDLVLMGQSEGFSIALLALKTRLGSKGLVIA